MKLSIVRSIRSRRVVSNGGLHLFVAHDLTSSITLFGLNKLCLKNACMRLSMVPSIRSRRIVSNGGPHLSIAHGSTSFIQIFGIYKLCSEKCVSNKALKYMYDAVDGTINQISSSSFEWWSSFFRSLFLALLREVVLNFIDLA